MKKVLFVSSYPYKKCGISWYSKLMLENMSNFDVEIDIQSLYFRKKLLTYPYNSLQLVHKIIMSNYDIIHFQYAPTIIGPLGPLFYFLSRFKKIVIVTTVHENADSYLNYLPPFLKYYFLRYVSFLLVNSNKIIVLTKKQKDIVSRVKSLNIGNISVIPIGIEDRKYIPNKRTVSKFKHFKNFKIIGFFGFLRQGKGLDILINSFIDVKKKIGNSCLIIAGKAENPKYLKAIKEIITKKAGKDIFILDFLPSEEMRYLMSISTCIVLPYTKNTNSAILMDAVSIETPIVGANLGSIKEYLESYNIGELFNVGDDKDLSRKTIELISNTRRLKSIKSKERILKKMYSWPHVSRMQYQLYKSL